MTKLETNSLFEKGDTVNKGYRDILSELVDDFITENISDLENMNTEEIIGTLSLTYKNNANSENKSET